MTSEPGKPARRRTPLQRALKSLERGVKQGVLALLTRAAATSAEARPDWNRRKQRVLFLRHDRIGDMIVSTAVIRAIARSHPNIEVDVLASPLNAAVIAHEPLVHRVIPFDVHRPAEFGHMLRQLRQARYDVVVDTMVFSQSLTTLLLMLATRAPHRVGVPKAGRPNVYTMVAQPAGADAHHVEHLAQLATPFGVPADQALALEIVLTDDERRAALAQWTAAGPTREDNQAGFHVLVNVSAGKSFRHWPDARFVEVVAHIRKRVPEARVLVLHAPADLTRATAMAHAASATRADTPGVREALALVATAHFVFTPDTSIVHAASAFRIPAVALFTADQVLRWKLFGTAGRNVVCDGETLDSMPLAPTTAAIDEVLAGGLCATAIATATATSRSTA